VVVCSSTKPIAKVYEQSPFLSDQKPSENGLTIKSGNSKLAPLPLTQKQTRKLARMKEKKRQDKESYRKNQMKTDAEIMRLRKGKFAKNNFSPGTLERMLKDVPLEFQIALPVGISLTDESLSALNNLTDTLGQGTSLSVGMSSATQDVLSTLNTTLSGVATNGINVTHGLEPNVIETLNSLNTTLSNVTSTIAGVGDIPGTVSAGISSVLDSGVKYAAFGVIIFAITSVVRHKRSPSKETASILVIALLILVFKSDSTTIVLIKDKVVSTIQSLMNSFGLEDSNGSSGGFVFQMDLGEFDSLMEILSLCVFGSIVGHAPTGAKTKSLFKEIGSFSKFLDGSKTVSRLVLNLLQAMTNAIRTNLLDSSSIVLIESDVHEVKTFVADCMKVADETHAGKFALNVPNGDLVHKIWVRGNSLISKYSHRDNLSLRMQVQTHMQYIAKIKAKFEQANILSLGTRQVPLCVLIRGPSGVGKSLSTVPLVVATLSGLLPDSEMEDFERNYESFIYGRQPEHVYWDGYRGQFVCAFDDFGQMKDVAGQGENEFSEFIRAGNIFGFILHMADIESKGGVAFKSKMCLCTTNLRDIAPNSIVEPEAVKRRFDLVVDQVPPAEFCREDFLLSGDLWSRRLDITKCEPGFDERACEYHVFDFKLNNGRGGYTGEVYNFDQFVSKMSTTYRKHEGNFGAFKSSLEDVKNFYLSKRKKIDFYDTPPELQFQMDLDDVLSDSDELDCTFADECFEEKRVVTTTDKIVDLCGDMHGAMLPVVSEAIVSLLSKGAATGTALSAEIDELYTRISKLTDKVLQGASKASCFDALYRSSTKMRKLLAETFSDIIDKRFDAETAMLFAKSTRKYADKIFAKKEAQEHLRGELVLHIPRRATSSWVEKGKKSLEFFKKYFEKVSSALSKFPSFVQWVTSLSYVEMICLAIGTVVGGLMLRGAIKSLIGIASFVTGGVVAFETQSHGRIREVHKNSKHAVKRMKERFSATKGKMAYQLGTSDMVLTQVVDKIVGKNTYELWINERKMAGIVTFVVGRLVLMPWHFITELALKIDENPELEENHIILKKTSSNIEYSVNVMWLFGNYKRATGFEGLDACLVQMPKEIPPHASILKHFVPHSVATKRRDKKFALICPGQKKDVEWHGEDYRVVQNKIVGNGNEVIVVRHGYEYRATSQRGDCGALMCIVDPSTGGQKIIGIHTGGNPAEERGFATAITFEDLEETVKEFEQDVELLDGDDMRSDVSITFDYQVDFQKLDGRFKPLATVSKALSMPSQTVIRKSRLYGEWGAAKTAPARLNKFRDENGETIDPFEEGLKNYCTPWVKLDHTMLKECAEHLYEDIRSQSLKPMESRILDFDEAILGLQDDPDYGSIPRNTSAGFPWNLQPDPRLPGKTKWFGKEQDFDLSGPDCIALKKQCEVIIESAKKNKRHLHVFSDYLKDERRPIAKVIKGKTRIICASPLPLSIVFRQYFGAFTLYMQKNKIDNGCANGVNPYSEDWHKLGQKLSQHGKKCGAGDYSKFDGSEKPQIHWHILWIINQFYDDSGENQRIREILWEEVVNSRHIHGNQIYEWVSSLPSGHAMTPWVNNLYNHMAFRYCWVRSHDGDAESLSVFKEHVYLCVLGDDNIFNITDECSDVFNQQTISVHMAELGLTYTDEMKGDKIIPFRKLEEVTFLKRSFRYEKRFDTLVAPLSMETILEMPYWTKKGSLRDTITKETTDTALMELSLHGPEVFNEWAPKIIGAYNSHYSEPLDKVLLGQLLTKSRGYEMYW